MQHRRRTPGRRRVTRAPKRQIETRKLLGLTPYGTTSLTELAERLGVSPQAINQWMEVPLSRVPEVEKVTGIPRHKLRPDYYEPPASTEPAAITSTA